MSKRNVVHVEIPAVNVEGAGKFYESLFGWKLQHMPEMNYTMWEDAGGAEVEGTDHFAILVARWKSPGLCVFRKQETGGLSSFTGHRQTYRRCQFQGIEFGSDLVARWPQAGSRPDEGRRLPDIYGQHRWFGGTAADPHVGHQYRTLFQSGRSVDLFHVGSRG